MFFKDCRLGGLPSKPSVYPPAEVALVTLTKPTLIGTSGRPGFNADCRVSQPDTWSSIGGGEDQPALCISIPDFHLLNALTVPPGLTPKSVQPLPSALWGAKVPQMKTPELRFMHQGSVCPGTGEKLVEKNWVHQRPSSSQIRVYLQLSLVFNFPGARPQECSGRQCRVVLQSSGV